MSMRAPAAAMAWFVVIALGIAPCAGEGLKLTKQGSRVVLENGQATALINTSTGTIEKIHCNDGVNLADKIHIHSEFLTGACDEFRVLRNEPSIVELSFVFRRRLDPADGDPALGMRIELRYAMRPDTPGIYAYFIWKCIGGPAVAKLPVLNRTNVSKFRIVALNMDRYYVDDERCGVYPMHGLEKKRMIYDATWIFSDGTIHSKYDDLSIQYRERLIGKYNDSHGIFFIIPSNEWAGGGPFKQRVCQQYDSLLFMHMLDGHCGLPINQPIFTEGWQRLFGPWLIYIAKAQGHQHVLESAKSAADVEVSRWPYTWLDDPAYMAGDRVKVRGRLQITDGSSPQGAFVMLGDPGMHYMERVQNYLYCTRTDAEGNFVMPAVRPGTFKLYAFVQGVMGEYVREGVVIPAGRDTELGRVSWTPEKFGETLWQIGVPNRTGEEFWRGKYHHQWGMHIIYPQSFPKDVDFYIAKSREENDWPYFQLTARTWDNVEHYNLGYFWDDTIKRVRFDFTKDKVPDKDDRSRFDPFTPVPYRIHFDLQKAYTGRATLSIAVAGVMFEGPLLVQVNGTDVTGGKPLTFPEASTLRRCTGIGVYNLTRVPFDASLLKQGENVMTLVAPKFAARRGGLPPKQSIGNIVYDCLRLEADLAMSR